MGLQKIADADFQTRFGKFRVHAFREGESREGKEHLVLVRCNHEVSHNLPLPVRIHSRCLTGDALTSRRCDCRDQLEESLKYLERKKCGIFIYLDQEGRGIGLANKIKAYALQDQGLDTVEANVKLGFDEDMRDFKPAAEILKHFGISSVNLLTNNPEKIRDLEQYGIKVQARIPLITKPTKYNRKYLETKRKKMKHFL